MIDDGDYKLIEIYDYKYYTIQIPSDPWNWQSIQNDSYSKTTYVMILESNEEG